MPLTKIVDGKPESVELKSEIPNVDFWTPMGHELFFQFQTKRSSNDRFESTPEIQDKLVEFLNKETTGAFYVDHETSWGMSKHVVYFADTSDCVRFMERFVEGDQAEFDYVHDAQTVNAEIYFKRLEKGRGDFSDSRLTECFSGSKVGNLDMDSPKAKTMYGFFAGLRFDV